MLSSPAALAYPVGQAVQTLDLTYWFAVHVAAAAPSTARRVQSAISTIREVARTIFVQFPSTDDEEADQDATQLLDRKLVERMASLKGLAGGNGEAAFCITDE